MNTLEKFTSLCNELFGGYLVKFSSITANGKDTGDFICVTHCNQWQRSLFIDENKREVLRAFAHYVYTNPRINYVTSRSAVLIQVSGEPVTDEVYLEAIADYFKNMR